MVSVIYYRMDATRGDIDGLLNRLEADDPAIIEAVFYKYHRQVYRLAVSILRDPDDAEDAVQDAFIKAAAALRRYQVGTNFKAWLFTITVNTCRSYQRKRGTLAGLKRTLQALHTANPSHTNPEQAALQKDTSVRLWELVDRLPEKHRMVVILRLAHDLSIREIGQVCKINEKTVYTRLYDAFSKLKKLLRGSPDMESLWKE
jgi:RNA polymerase sigma factor (sigma-70 family)